MSYDNPLHVTSEIGKLVSVILHRPSAEIENLTPNLMEKLLFDEIPYLKEAIREHDYFARTLKEQGVEVLYLQDLVVEAIEDRKVREALIKDFLNEARIYDERMKYALLEYFDNKDDGMLIRKMMSGIRKNEIPNIAKSLAYLVDETYPFILDPMPNLYFTRDPAATIGNGITINKMRTSTRNRETLFMKYIIEYNPRFKDSDVPILYNRNEKTSLEGGDTLILNKNVLAIGISERSEAHSVETLAKNIFNSGQSFHTILAFNIPKKRAFMHLDTVFTMIDYNKFTIHHEIEGPLTVYSITKEKDDSIKITEEKATLQEILKKYLGLTDITLIRCAGGDKIDGPREQWNDGSNTLAIAPGEVVVYSRNYVTNRILNENGVKTHVIHSSELSRGRGGPRCMSMPIIREDI
ncbi:arginine deiminase [Vallitalea sp.]|jgi:arginine deiminase|uniref:arginine deiminase n=1 Tax=Vallitalea sp. TaxID=1882829 RepID=UPI0025D7B63B|nr:arginine deiminase [Vallitalea sp.]MCT4687246.1 arginine deiminase [Vallitalea sp.]